MRIAMNLLTAQLSTIYGDIVALCAIGITLFHPLHIHPRLAVIGLGWYGCILLDRLIVYWRNRGPNYGK